MIDAIRELLGMAKRKNKQAEEKRKARNKGSSTYEPPKMKTIGGRKRQLDRIESEIDG